jgi:hypothetical protein
MKTRLAICLALAAATSALAAIPASAQQALLPPHEIATSVRSLGLEPISRPERRGARRYVLRAIDRRGAEVVVIANGVNGRIIAVRPAGFDEAPVDGPVYAERYYPRAYPESAVPPRGSYERPRNSQQQGSYEQQGNYDRQPLRNPQDPSVIYANPQTSPQPPVRAPSAAKPPAPKVAAKPAPKPAAAAVAAAPAESAQPEQPATTGTTSSPPADTSALAIPPVQSLE